MEEEESNVRRKYRNEDEIWGVLNAIDKNY